MAPASLKDIKLSVRFVQSYLLHSQPGSEFKSPVSGFVRGRKFVSTCHLYSPCGSNMCSPGKVEKPVIPESSIVTGTRPCLDSCSRDALLNKLNVALADHKVEEAWEAFSNFKSLYGLPIANILSKLIVTLSYSSDSQLLQNIYALARSASIENPELINLETLVRLCLSLARAQMPIPASKILRLMLWRQNLPQMDAFCVVVMHMVRSQVGTCLATNLLVEMCNYIHCVHGKKSAHATLSKPGTKVFNLILDACVRFQLTIKGEQIIELMARMGIVADAESILIFANIYETNGQRDQLRSFKEHVDKVSLPLAKKYRLFYDKMLSLHFKFDDIDAASGLISDMYRCWTSRPVKCNNGQLRPFGVPIGSQHLRDVLHVQIMPELQEKDSILLFEGGEEFVALKSERLVLSSKGLAQIILRYKKNERISELSKLIADMQKALESAGESSLCRDVIIACIHNGWLETAHDIIDDMEMASVCVPSEAYMLLLLSYGRKSMIREAKVLGEQMKQLDLLVNTSVEKLISQISDVVGSESICSSSDLIIANSRPELADLLALEISRESQVPSTLYELNASINFFCKAKMIEDALKAYRKMQSLKIQPTVHTFAYLIQAYSSLGMFREITILWGDMKRNICHVNTVENGDLYDLLVLNFIRGGYFGRALEIINLMQEHGFYADKWVYKTLFLKHHKNLYRNLKASDAKAEAQLERLELVKAFRKWVR